MADSRDDDADRDRTDPLGLGGVPDVDAPSRKPQPRRLALLGEFLRMSRTTAILLGVFVLVSALYLLVKDDPVVNFNPGPPAPTEPADPTGPEESTTTATDDATDTSEPTPTTDPDSTGTTDSTVPTTEDDSGTTPGRGGVQLTESPAQSSPAGPGAPGQAEPTGSPDVGVTGSPDGGQVTE